MTLKYSNRTTKIAEIENRLRELTLAYHVEVSTEKTEPMLSEGRTEYLGIDKMNTFLDQLDREKEQWYYCGC